MFHSFAFTRVFIAIRRLCLILLTALALNFVVVDASAHAATYYVATTGSDSNPGSEAAPFRTIAKGSQTMASGDTLYIGRGTYNEGIKRFASGTRSAYTRYVAYPGEQVILMPTTKGIVYVSPSMRILTQAGH